MVNWQMTPQEFRNVSCGDEIRGYRTVHEGFEGGSVEAGGIFIAQDIDDARQYLYSAEDSCRSAKLWMVSMAVYNPFKSWVGYNAYILSMLTAKDDTEDYGRDPWKIYDLIQGGGIGSLTPSVRTMLKEGSHDVILMGHPEELQLVTCVVTDGVLHYIEVVEEV